MNSRTLQLRRLMRINGLSVPQTARLLMYRREHMWAMRAGRVPVHPRTIRHLELEIAELMRQVAPTAMNAAVQP